MSEQMSEVELIDLKIKMIKMSGENYTYFLGQVDPSIQETIERLEKEKELLL